LFRKNSRKNEEKNNDDSIYLQIEYAQFTPSFSKCNIGKLIEQPKGVQYNEWIATNCMNILLVSIYLTFFILVISFSNHINLLYEVLTDLCTNSTCPTMNGPQNRFENIFLFKIKYSFFSIYYFDEKNKKMKCSAPEYIDNAMTFIQKTISNEEIFPTRLGNYFLSFEKQTSFF
jgi:hypothetical protein